MITGWGSTRQRGAQSVGLGSMVDPALDRMPGTRSLPTTLQEAEVSIMSNDDCWQKTGYTQDELHGSMICAQGNSSKGITDACQGDNGGPMVCENSGKWSI